MARNKEGKLGEPTTTEAKEVTKRLLKNSLPEDVGRFVVREMVKGLVEAYDEDKDK